MYITSKFEKRKEKAIEQSEITPQTIDWVISQVEQHLQEKYDPQIKAIKISNPDGYVYSSEFIESGCLKELWDDRFANGGTFLWLKFTTSGHLGVVAKSKFSTPDINFSEENTSGRLVKTAGLKWDCSYVYLFPLGHPDTAKSSEQECELGDWLIGKNVPIIDYYSHRFFTKM